MTSKDSSDWLISVVALVVAFIFLLLFLFYFLWGGGGGALDRSTVLAHVISR